MEFWIILLVVSALLVAAWVQSERKMARQLQRSANLLAIKNIVTHIQSDIEKLQALKSPAAKVNRCRDIEKKLDQIGHYDECREMVEGYDELKRQIPAMMKAYPVVAHVEKAYKFRFKGSEKSELNALLGALYEIQTNEVTDADFINAKVMPEGTGEIIQTGGIIARLKELGWDGPKDGSRV